MSHSNHHNFSARLPLQVAPVARTAGAGAMNGGVEPSFLPLLLGALTSLR
jgi:hypothetical protein